MVPWKNKSLGKILNNKGTDIEFWGTPNKFFSHELKVPFISVLSLQFDR